MSVGGITLSLDATELRQLQESLKNIFDNPGLAATLKAALDKAIKPPFEKLKQVAQVGPTGNLRRAVAKKVISYSRDGAAVALVGFRRAGRASSSSAAGGSVQAGPDRAFHQWWLEFGTKDRTIGTYSNTPYNRRAHERRLKSGKTVQVKAHPVSGQNAFIASSFRELGPFKMLPTPRLPRGEEGQRVQTGPAFPKAFFKKGKKGQPLVIPAMPAGGSTGQPPVQTAWDATQGEVAQILQRELRLSLEQALAKLSVSAGSII